MIVLQIENSVCSVRRDPAKVTNLSVFIDDLTLIFALKHEELSVYEISPKPDQIIFEKCTNLTFRNSVQDRFFLKSKYLL